MCALAIPSSSRSSTPLTVVSGEIFGARLREVRLKRGLSQQALAELVGLPQPHAMESGAKFPNLLTVLRLAVALECKVM
ncbi:MAG TPA: helix-turn-helix transcriptional regulator [Thermoanaerobaculia bacterium]|jgi:transcriptional regulator with XRE-family HTH domain|nr:helix-turn-helix transcriptional regulator [Thermoanaerobaculia bacterium]